MMFRDGGQSLMVGSWLSGSKVNLRPLRDADIDRRAGWLRDAETVRLFAGAEPTYVYGRMDGERWRQTMETDPNALIWAVETKEHRHIGDVDLHCIDYAIQAARLTILLGDKEFWNRGYGTDTIRTLLRYAFADVKLDMVSLKVYHFNKRAIQCYEKCGFEQAGVVPQATMISLDSGQPPEICMNITSDRFLAEQPNAFSVYSESR